MRVPIKLNRSILARRLWGVLPCADDPHPDEHSFSRAVSTFKFGTTFKATQKQRFPLTLEALTQLHQPRQSDAALDDLVPRGRHAARCVQ
jgi:hypothetical protein